MLWTDFRTFPEGPNHLEKSFRILCKISTPEKNIERDKSLAIESIPALSLSQK